MLCAVILENMNHEFAQDKINKSDEFYTLDYAIKPLLKYIPSDKTIWCPFDKEESNFVKLLRENGNTVIYSHIEEGKNFFEYEPQNYDMIISNPPYSLRTPILERLFFNDSVVILFKIPFSKNLKLRFKSSLLSEKLPLSIEPPITINFPFGLSIFSFFDKFNFILFTFY